ncbi:MAG: TRAP transporter fused permease subunit [Burkholderiaceae bacterium]
MRGSATAIIAAALALQTIYVAYFGGWEPRYHRAVALFVCILIGLGTMPLADRLPARGPAVRALGWVADAAMLAVAAYGCFRFIGAIEDIDNLVVEFTLFDQLAALGSILVVLELARRAFGWVLPAVAAVSLAYALFGENLPWVLQHSGFDLNQTMEIVWYGFQGVFGFPTGIVLSLILIFIVLGAFLEATGAGEALIRIAFGLTGATRGGPAHAAIAASALFGTTSGSVTANVVGTGVFTIPMIKRRGFSAEFAGAVEAAASTGGQIMPPVMGAAAFLMVDLTGTPYLTICLAALVPSLLYYLSLFVSVTIEARRLGIEPLPAEQRPRLQRHDLVASLMLVMPIVTLIYVLLAGRSPAMAGFWAVVTTIVTAAVLNPVLRREPGRIWQALVNGGVAGAKIMLAVATIGVLLAVLNLTGIGLKFALELTALGSGSLIYALLLAAGACIVLGMGMPTLPAYLIIALVLGPAIKDMGLPMLAVHLFVFYFGVLSAITPPVAIAAIAAAPIAGAGPMITAARAVGLAAVGFLIPFVFVFEPSLLLVIDFEWGTFLWILARLLLAIWLMSTGFQGYETRALGLASRSLRFLRPSPWSGRPSMARSSVLRLVPR